jgi:hypothetical protein
MVFPFAQSTACGVVRFRLPALLDSSYPPACSLAGGVVVAFAASTPDPAQLRDRGANPPGISLGAYFCKHLPREDSL